MGPAPPPGDGGDGGVGPAPAPPQGGLGSLFGFGPQASAPPGEEGDFGPDGFPDEQPSGGMAFFFGGPEKGGYMPPGIDGPEDGEGPPMDLFNAPGIWTSGGVTSIRTNGDDSPAGGVAPPPPGDPIDAEVLRQMFLGPEGPEGPGDGPAAPGGFRGFIPNAGPPIPGEEPSEAPDGDGGIAAVFGLRGEGAKPQEFQREAAQTFFFGEKEELVPPAEEGDGPGNSPDDPTPQIEEAQTFFTPADEEIADENTFFNPEAEQEVVIEENNFFNANAQVEVEMPESTFFSPNNFTEEEYREKIAEQMGIDPDLVTVTPAGG